MIQRMLELHSVNVSCVHIRYILSMCIIFYISSLKWKEEKRVVGGDRGRSGRAEHSWRPQAQTQTLVPVTWPESDSHTTQSQSSPITCDSGTTGVWLSNQYPSLSFPIVHQCPCGPSKFVTSFESVPYICDIHVTSIR